MSTSDTTQYDFDLPEPTSEATPIFGAFAVLWFLAFGAGAAYFSVTQYLSGSPLLSVQVLGIAGAAIANFVVVGVVVTMITWRSPTLPEEAPWTLRPAWRSPSLEEDLYFRTVPPRFAALLGVVGWGGGAVALYFNYWLPQSPDPGSLLFLIFPLGFSVPAVFSLRRAWHRRKYGTSSLVMETMPARVGRSLSARLRPSIRPADAHDDTLHVELSCYHRSPRGESSSWRQKWRAETEVRERAASSPEEASGARTEVPISFELPVDAPPSTPEKKSHRIAWILEVSAEMKGLDYASYFEIPVFEPETTNEETNSSRASKSPQASASRQSPSPPPRSPSIEESSPATGGAPQSTESSSGAPSLGPGDEASGSEERGSPADAKTVRCDNCRSAVPPSAEACPACGSNLEAGWFS